MVAIGATSFALLLSHDHGNLRAPVVSQSMLSDGQMPGQYGQKFV